MSGEEFKYEGNPLPIPRIGECMGKGLDRLRLCDKEEWLDILESDEIPAGSGDIVGMDIPGVSGKVSEYPLIAGEFSMLIKLLSPGGSALKCTEEAEAASLAVLPALSSSELVNPA